MHAAFSALLDYAYQKTILNLFRDFCVLKSPTCRKNGQYEPYFRDGIDRIMSSKYRYYGISSTSPQPRTIHWFLYRLINALLVSIPFTLLTLCHPSPLSSLIRSFPVSLFSLPFPPLPFKDVIERLSFRVSIEKCRRLVSPSTCLFLPVSQSIITPYHWGFISRGL